MSTRVRIDLSPEAFGRLVEAGISECRPVGMQAEVLLLRALGLDPPPFTAHPISEASPSPDVAPGVMNDLSPTPPEPMAADDDRVPA